MNPSVRGSSCHSLASSDEWNGVEPYDVSGTKQIKKLKIENEGAQSNGGTIPTELGLLSYMTELKINENAYHGWFVAWVCFSLSVGAHVVYDLVLGCSNRENPLAVWPAHGHFEAAHVFEHAHGQAAIGAGEDGI